MLVARLPRSLQGPQPWSRGRDVVGARRRCRLPLPVAVVIDVLSCPTPFSCLLQRSQRPEFPPLGLLDWKACVLPLQMGLVCLLVAVPVRHLSG